MFHYTPFEGCLEKVVLRLNLSSVGSWRVYTASSDVLAINTCMGRLGKLLLEDWKTNGWKLMPEQQQKFCGELPTEEAKRHIDPPVPQDLQVLTVADSAPSLSQDFRKKWLQDVAYGPEWAAEMKKFDELLATHGIEAAAAPSTEESGGQANEDSELPAAWMPSQLEKVVEGFQGEQHRFPSKYNSFEFLLLVAGSDEPAKLYLVAKEECEVPAKESLLAHGNCEWIKPPKSTRMLSNTEEKRLHTFEIRDDLQKVAWYFLIVQGQGL